MESTSQRDNVKRPVPILTRENYRSWFQSMRDYLEGEGYYWIIEDDTNVAPTPTSATASSSSAEPTEPMASLLHSMHSPDWRKANGKVRYNLTLCLDQDDKDEVEELRSARKVWTYLWQKYNKRFAADAMAFVQEYVNFKMQETQSIRSAWVHLANLGRQIAEMDPAEAAYKDPSKRIKHLLAALPHAYQSMRTTINAQVNLQPDDILMLLESQEAQFKQELGEDMAMYSRLGYKPNLRKDNQPSGFGCPICDKTDHRIRQCPSLPAARRAVSRGPKASSSSSLAPRQRRRSSPKADDLRTLIKNLSAEVALLKKARQPRKHKAFPVQDKEPDTEAEEPQSPSSDGPSDGEDYETVAFNATELQGKLSLTEWLLDSGATAHMTDQPSSFRQPMIPIKRRWIKVGGGRYLASDFCGQVVIHDKSGKSIELRALLVPELGVNLISGRRLSAEHNLFGLMAPEFFAMIDSQFQSHLHFARQGGVYVLTQILRPLGLPDQELALQCASHDYALFSDSDKYQLMHRRFAHLGPEKLRSLHRVTTLAEPIPIVPSTECPCEVCALTKIKNRRGQVTSRKLGVLELISVDVCGPIQASRKKEAYFLLIVDNHSRKHWVFPMVHKSDSPQILNKWKLRAELETDLKLKAVRCDNAPELVRHFKSWERDFGVALNPTEAYNSLQNGVAERFIQTCEYNMRALLKDARMPNEFWPEALQASVYVTNRTSGPSIDDHIVTPEEAYTGKRPSVDHIRVWGCKCIAYMNPKSLPIFSRKDKLMDRGRVGVFMGYCDTTKNFLMWAPDMKDVITVHNLKWFENEKGGDMNLGIPILSTSNAAPERRPQGRPITKLPTPVQPARRVAQVLIQPPSAAVQADFIPMLDPEDAEESDLGRNPTQKHMGRNSTQKDMGRNSTQNDMGGNPTQKDMGGNPTQGDFPRPTVGKSGSSRTSDFPRPTVGNSGSPRSRSRSRSRISDFPRPTVGNSGSSRTSKDSQDPKPSPLNEPEPEPMDEEPSFSTLVPQQYAGAKRLREEDEEGPQSKIHRAFQAIEQLAMEGEENCDGVIDWAFSGMESDTNGKVPLPRNFHAAVNDPKWGHLWREATNAEFTALAGNQTFDQPDVPPQGANIVSSRWVFAVKYNPDGTVKKFKARIVARGFSQKYGIDFEETFAPTVRHDTLRIFMAVVAQMDLECHQIDVNNAFTESTLQEEIWMEPPDGMSVLPGQKLRVRRSLYGLKQAARDWNKTCTKELFRMGFIQSEADPCLLMHPTKGIIILVYVDDITIASKDISQVNWFKSTFGTAFKIKDLGEVNMILGVRVTRDRKQGTLRLDQTHYVDHTLGKLSMAKESHKPTKSPMDSYDDLRPAKPTDQRCNKTEYQEGVGSWMYLAILTRPDVAFALGRLSQFLADPTVNHMSALKKLGRYIRSSKELGIMYTKGSHQTLEGYSDSDFAMDRTDRVSILGNVFKLSGGPVSWSSKKQKSVATSTMEAEYMAMCACAKQSQWLAQILRDMGMHKLIGKDHSSPLVKENHKHFQGSPMQDKPVALKGDNQAALSLIQDAHITDRSKHIDIAFHYVRMLWQKRRITVQFVGTEDMIADGFTKPKGGDPMQRFVQQLGLVQD
jgi:hypothetical protein